MVDALTRSHLAEKYLEQLPYAPYPLQEDALLAWFTSEQGVLVCAPTGTGKTLIAQAALFEALHTGQVAYYTTPLIALTEQKFQEMQASAVRWGFSPDDVGLVTGNRRVNPNAKVLIVVAEILLNRLLNPEAFDFREVSAVVMDEFHSFADPERGIVWELSLNLLPPQVRLLLLSATVGNSQEFLNWLERCHHRKLQLVEGTERKVPLTYQYVPDKFLAELLPEMAEGEEHQRKTPALVFCFNRDECWNVAEQLKGQPLLSGQQKVKLAEELAKFEWKEGAAPKLKSMLQRGVGVHHAGLLPKYRRMVEDLFVRKLLAVVVCTETLAAGINLPARSVVVTALMKGPHGKKKLIEASSAHQIFGRAGRPQFDDKGYIFVLAHEDDVKIERWRVKYNQIPDNTKDPGLLKVKKDLERKRPTRRDTEQYWQASQFEKLKNSPPGKLYSKGPLPWRLLAYMLKLSPEVDKIRSVVRKRFLDEGRIRAGEAALDRMLLALAEGGFVTLDPAPPPPAPKEQPPTVPPPPPYKARLAMPTERLDKLLVFRSVHPVYGAFLLDQLGIADQAERLQALESVLELPRPLLRYVRVPFDLPPGPLAATRLDADLVQRGLMIAKVPASALAEGEEAESEDEEEFEEHPPLLAEKLKLLFDALYPDVTDVQILPVWAAGELLRFSGDFNKYVKTRDLIKQEGLIFRHLLRLILLCHEFAEATPPDYSAEQWKTEMFSLAEQFTASCRAVDPTSTDEIMQQLHAADVVEGETTAAQELKKA
jgi:superfamily II DNA/RNA helicase